jgi:hypothetical protein
MDGQAGKLRSIRKYGFSTNDSFAGIILADMKYRSKWLTKRFRMT